MEPDIGPDRLPPRFKTPALREEAVADQAGLRVSRAERVALQARVVEIEAPLERDQIDIARTIINPIDGWSAARSRWLPSASRGGSTSSHPTHTASRG